MRTARLLTLLLVSLLQAQETKVKSVGATPTSPASGKEMFRAYCASCRGLDGKGGGPVAPALKNKPADLTLLSKASGGKFPAMRVMNSIKGGALAHSIPSTYLGSDGKQYLVVVTGGGRFLRDPNSDALIAFALPKNAN